MSKLTDGAYDLIYGYLKVISERSSEFISPAAATDVLFHEMLDEGGNLSSQSGKSEGFPFYVDSLWGGIEADECLENGRTEIMTDDGYVLVGVTIFDIVMCTVQKRQ